MFTFLRISRQLNRISRSNSFKFSRNFAPQSNALSCNKYKYKSKEENSENKWNLNYKTVPLILTSFLAVAHCKSIVNDQKTKRFFRIVRFGILNELEYLLSTEDIDVNQRHPLGWTALMIAVVNDEHNVAEYLLKKGADPNLSDNFSTVSKVAKTHGLASVEVAMIRVEEFTDRLNNSASFLGFTPLHYAALLNNLKLCSLLIEHGADPSLQTDAGHKPVHFAAKEGPIKNLLENEMKKHEEKKKQKELEERRLFPLEERLKQYIVGQEGAITTVAGAIRRKENGWSDDDHPLVFLFLGSSGIGKTELAKQLAAYMHRNNKDAFIRLDMSEYQEKHEVAKLIGAPPGYIGHDDGGQLTKKLKKCPNAVVLFDEVDKAHTDVLTVLLQLFDEGRLTDGQGKTIECKDAIFIMTSNLASEEIARHGLQLRHEVEKLRAERLTSASHNFSENIKISRKWKDEVVRPILKRHFRRDEFLGRINEIVYFLPFSRNELLQLVKKEMEIWAKRATDKHKIEIKWDRSVESALADGYDVHYGARSIKYEVERQVVNKLAAAHEKGLIGNGAVVQITTQHQEEEESPEIKLRVKLAGHKDFVEIDHVSVKSIVKNVVNKFILLN